MYKRNSNVGDDHERMMIKAGATLDGNTFPFKCLGGLQEPESY